MEDFLKKYQKATFNELVQKEEERSLLACVAEDPPASEGEEVKEAADGFDEEVKEAADGFGEEVKEEAADGFGEEVNPQEAASTIVPPWRVQPLPDPPSRSSKSKSSRVPPPADEHIESPASAEANMAIGNGVDLHLESSACDWIS